MKTIEDMGALFLSTRLKRLSDNMYDEVDAIYDALEIKMNSRWTSVLFILHDNGNSGVTQLAETMGLTHPAISQMSRKLIEQGYVENIPDANDERRRLLGLTEQGRQLVEQLKPVWERIHLILDERIDSGQHHLLKAITHIEKQQEKQSFSSAVLEVLKLSGSNEIEIIPYAKEYAADFKRLNVEWLEKYFYVEKIDDQVLSKPKKYILSEGGDIFFARYQGEIVGTCALIRVEETKGNKITVKYELSKMAVTEKYQGLKIGKKLLDHTLKAYRKTDGKCLFLESNSRLKPALKLYENAGFVHKPNPVDSHYQRADVYMEWQPE